MRATLDRTRNFYGSTTRNGQTSHKRLAESFISCGWSGPRGGKERYGVSIRAGELRKGPALIGAESYTLKVDAEAAADVIAWWARHLPEELWRKVLETRDASAGERRKEEAANAAV